MDLKDFWYIAAESKELGPGKVLATKLLGEWIALFRDEEGRAVALQDRCLHRAARLSAGRVENGRLVCPYHGWTYDGEGRVVRIPSEGPGEPRVKRCGKRYAVIEQQGYVYVRLGEDRGFAPFSIPAYGEKGYRHIRLKNHFKNDVTNCAENFVDIPHTVFVHPGIFRDAKGQKLSATIERQGGSVRVSYKGETANLGWFSRFLNPDGHEIQHFDNFHMPNITSVEYVMGQSRHFFITSQSIPVTDKETVVYTDLTYNYGVWTHLVAPIVRWHAQAIIDQDIEILGNQRETIDKYGAEFQNSPADLIHVYIESIRGRLARGEDPRELPPKSAEIEFWV